MNSNEVVERVREAADILQVIGEHVKLRRAGADWRGPCPFHGGKNPNFSVSPKRGQYHCFKCGESGDVFSFVQKHLGMSFPDALQTVAAIAGVEVPEQRRADRAGPDEREPFWEMNAVAADFLRRVLWEEPRAATARAYLDERGLSREVADRFELGYAPSDTESFRSHMETMGFYTDRLVEGGLLFVRDDGSDPRPRFRNRLMFPILDAKGRHIAFGGRALGDFEPKYLNSPETRVFNKSSTLYALNWCRNGIRKADRVFVVEGYMDAIRLMANGVDTVVAPLGTALTEPQATGLAKYTKNVFLLYDSDQAGLKATFRTGDELLRHGCSVRVITLPSGEDPDTFVRANGAAGLEEHVGRALDVFERKIQILDRAGWFAELQKKRRALDRLLPTIRATSDPLLRELYIARAAEKSGVAREVLLREADNSPREVIGPIPEERPVERPRTVAGGRRGERRANHHARGYAAERELVRAIVSDPARAAGIAEKMDPDRFFDPAYRAIFVAILTLGESMTLESLAESLDEDAVAILNSLLEDAGAQIDPERTVSESLASLARRDIAAQQAEIDGMLSVASESEKIELANDKIRLQKEAALLGHPYTSSTKLLGRRKSAPRE